MIVFFIRHGAAEPLSSLGSDRERPLSHEGKRQAERLGYWLGTVGISFDRLWVSPLLRAQETAAILVRLGLAQEAEVNDLLLPEKDPQALAMFVQQFSSAATVAFVGHEPLLSQAIETLLLCKPCGVVTVGKGGGAMLEGEGKRWLLAGLIRSHWIT